MDEKRWVSHEADDPCDGIVWERTPRRYATKEAADRAAIRIEVKSRGECSARSVLV